MKKAILRWNQAFRIGEKYLHISQEPPGIEVLGNPAAQMNQRTLAS
jgi:hypothetical protein